MRNLLLVLITILMIAGSAQAATVDFDDFSSTYALLPSGYQGFDWNTNCWYINGSNYPGTGYETGTVSGRYAFFTAYASEAVITRSDNSVFTFNSAYFTAAWNIGQQVDIKGFLNGSELYSTTITISPAAAVLHTLNFEGIDTLTMATYGGTDYSETDGGYGLNMVMDDFTYNEPVGPSAVPEPSTVALLLAGFVGLIGFSIKRRS